MAMNTLQDFKPGDRVLYVPYHANGDTKHEDCELGFVSSTNDKFVFVRYANVRGEISDRGIATMPDQLVKL